MVATPATAATARADPSGRYPSSRRESSLLAAVNLNPAAFNAGNAPDAVTPSAKRIITTGSPARFARWKESSADKLGSWASERATICRSVPVSWGAHAVAQGDNG